MLSRSRVDTRSAKPSMSPSSERSRRCETCDITRCFCDQEDDVARRLARRGRSRSQTRGAIRAPRCTWPPPCPLPMSWSRMPRESGAASSTSSSTLANGTKSSERPGRDAVEALEGLQRVLVDRVLVVEVVLHDEGDPVELGKVATEEARSRACRGAWSPRARDSAACRGTPGTPRGTSRKRRSTSRRCSWTARLQLVCERTPCACATSKTSRRRGAVEVSPPRAGAAGRRGPRSAPGPPLGSKREAARAEAPAGGPQHEAGGTRAAPGRGGSSRA